VRIGIIARGTAQTPGCGVRAIPGDRKGQIAHELAMKVSDSHWHLQLSEDGERNPVDSERLLDVAFRNYKNLLPLSGRSS